MSKSPRETKPDAGAARGEVLSPRVSELVEDLHALCDAVEAGAPLAEVATVRTYRLNAAPPELSPDDVRSIRQSLAMSRARFADFLGGGPATV